MKTEYTKKKCVCGSLGQTFESDKIKFVSWGKTSESKTIY